MSSMVMDEGEVDMARPYRVSPDDESVMYTPRGPARGHAEGRLVLWSALFGDCYDP